MSAQGEKMPIGLIPSKYFVIDLKLFNKNSSEFHCVSFVNLFGCEKESRIKWHKGPLGQSTPLHVLVFYLMIVGDMFMFAKHFFLIVDQRGTKAHWVNPLPIFKHNYVNFVEKISMYKKRLMQ